MRESWPRETMKAVLKGIQQDIQVENNKKDYFEVLHAPLARGFLEGLQRKLRRLQIGLAPRRKETLYTNLCNLKPKADFVESKYVIYFILCKECGGKIHGRNRHSTKEIFETTKI